MWTTEATATCSAPPEAVWRLYADVQGWPQWDDGLERCSIGGEFRPGTTGELTPKGSPVSFPFTLMEVIPNEHFSDTTELPGGTLRVSHHLERGPEGTRITHRVSITGPAWQEIAAEMGAGFEADLPRTVASLARLAETQAALPR